MGPDVHKALALLAPTDCVEQSWDQLARLRLPRLHLRADVAPLKHSGGSTEYVRGGSEVPTMAHIERYEMA